MKNLVLFHLETVNNSIFNNLDESFINIKEFISKAIRFNNYYSSATSTLMVICDLLYGNMTEFDDATYLEDILHIKPKNKSLCDIYSENGFAVKNYFLSDFENNSLLNSFNNIISKKNTCWTGESQHDMLHDINMFLANNKKFFLFVDDNSSHISYIGERFNNSKQSVKNLYWYKERYKRIDDTFGNLLKIINNNNCLENTLIILYGDHGEDFYFHKLYDGYTHANEPYNHMISCPLIIFDGKNFNINNHSLISTIDIFNYIINGVFDKNDYIISRNLYPKQDKKAKIFNKCYSICDGNYSLLSSLNGLEMYINFIDNFNNCNILNFFNMCNQKIIFNEMYYMLGSTHFKSFFSKEEIAFITSKFNFLYNILINETKSINFSNKAIILNKINYDRSKFYLSFISIIKFFMKKLRIRRQVPVNANFYFRKSQM